MLGLADEYSKVMGGGISSDTGRAQALDILKDAYSNGQLTGAVATMRADIDARKSVLIRGNRVSEQTYGASGSKVERDSTISVTDPDGGVHTFANQVDADKFKTLAGIK